MMSILAFGPLAPGDTDFFMFDFGDATLTQGACLEAGDTILTATVSTSVWAIPAGVASAADLNVTGAVIGGTEAAPMSVVTTTVQPSGTLGVTYLITMTITTANGRTLVRSGSLLIANL